MLSFYSFWRGVDRQRAELECAPSLGRAPNAPNIRVAPKKSPSVIGSLGDLLLVRGPEIRAPYADSYIKDQHRNR